MADGFRGKVVKRDKNVSASIFGKLQVYPPGWFLHLPMLCTAPSPFVCVPLSSVWVIPLSVWVAPWTDYLRFIPSVTASMVRSRQRFLSRRGTSRGGTSCPPAGDSYTHCCLCHGIHSTGANPLHSSQFMDAGAPEAASLTAFGSAIFNFSSSLNSPQISAHVSVVFVEAPQEDNDSPAIMVSGMMTILSKEFWILEQTWRMSQKVWWHRKWDQQYCRCPHGHSSNCCGRGVWLVPDCGGKTRRRRVKMEFGLVLKVFLDRMSIFCLQLLSVYA